MGKGNKFKKDFVSYRINHQIHSPTVRLLDDQGKQIGVIPISEALALSLEQSLDLVEVAPGAQPPVVKLIDYNKFLYQLKKKKQEEKKHTHASETKQVQFGPFIDDHDLQIKLSRAKEFIADGDKVRFVVKFRGREMTKQDLGRGVLNKVLAQLSEIARIEREIKMEGRQMVMVMAKGRTESKSAREDVDTAAGKEETAVDPTIKNETETLKN